MQLMNLNHLPLNTSILSFNVKDFVLVKKVPLGENGALASIFPHEKGETRTPRFLSMDILLCISILIVSESHIRL